MRHVAEESERILLAHGGGGERMRGLLAAHILPGLRAARPGGNGVLPHISAGHLTDGAVLPWADGSLVLTTDSYVVTPIEFPGGDIGRLAVCGTVNDLAVMGADPVALSLGLILEEGLPLDALQRVMRSISAAAEEAGVAIVTGDTKVIERRSDAPGLMINTAGVGRLPAGARLGVERVAPGDCVLVNGTLAEHGLAVLSVRSGMEFETPLRSDAAPLNGLVRALLESGADVKFLRDATRGGVAGVLADVAEDGGVGVEIDEARVPLTATARRAAELFGLDPLSVANEGKLVCVVAKRDCAAALGCLQAHPLGRNAACIGRTVERQPPLVELVTRHGGRRILQRPYGEELPRIC